MGGRSSDIIPHLWPNAKISFFAGRNAAKTADCCACAGSYFGRTIPSSEALSRFRAQKLTDMCAEDISCEVVQIRSIWSLIEVEAGKWTPTGSRLTPGPFE